MVDEAIKRRIREAKKRAAEMLVDVGYDIIPSDNERVCLTATRDTEVRFIRIVIDKITPKDMELMRSLQSPGPGVCKKEIWCSPYGSKKFRKERVN